MALILSDFTFKKLPLSLNDKVEIQFTNYVGWLTIKVKVDDTTLEYECNHTDYSLPQLLEAFIDIIWEYAATDKYFHNFRTRSRIEHDAESRGTVMWDLRYHSNATDSSSFDILIRNNFNSDAEYEVDYYHYRDPEAIKKVQGNVWLCITIDTKVWVAALLKACDEFLAATPDQSEEDSGGWCKAKFPVVHVEKLRLWLTTPNDSYKWQKLNPRKGLFDNTEGMISDG